MLQQPVKSRTLKIVLGIVGTIFLGAIGSGLWDVLLRHVVAWLSDLVLSLTSTIFRGYVDVLYRGVSRNPTFHIFALPYVAFVVFTVFGPWAFLWTLLRSLRQLERRVHRRPGHTTPEELAERVVKLRRLLLLAGIPAALVSSTLYVEMFFRDQHARRAELFVERSIEIVAPTLDERARLELRSQFRSIECAADFYKLEDRLRAIAKQQSSRLPEFSSIR